jgi:hypothetical protein
MKTMRLLLAVVTFAILSGCNTRAKFEDVSNKGDYRSYIGVEYVLKVPTHLSGVNLPPGHRKVIDVYVVNPASSTFTGPELVSRDTLPPGTLIIVDSVHRCKNCFLDFGERLEAHIRIPRYRSAFDHPVKIALKYLEPQFAERVKIQPNQALEPTLTAVTDRAAHAPRQL